MMNWLCYPKPRPTQPLEGKVWQNFGSHFDEKRSSKQTTSILLVRIVLHLHLSSWKKRMKMQKVEKKFNQPTCCGSRSHSSAQKSLVLLIRGWSEGDLMCNRLPLGVNELVVYLQGTWHLISGGLAVIKDSFPCAGRKGVYSRFNTHLWSIWKLSVCWCEPWALVQRRQNKWQNNRLNFSPKMQ